MRFVFIGHGRLAQHFSTYLQNQGHQSLIWSRRSDSKLPDVIQTTDVLCLSMSDSDLPRWSEHLKELFPFNTIVHFSGALNLPGIFSFHPLVSFSHEFYNPEFYRTIPIVGVLGQPAFDEIFSGLENPYYEISADHKTMYHALVSMAANFPQLLWKEIAGELHQKLNLDFELLRPLLQKSLENSLRFPNTAPTGPIVRNDRHTIYKHLAVVDRQDLRHIYYSFLDLNKKISIQPTEVNHDAR